MSLSQLGYYVSAGSPIPPAAPMSSSQHSPTSCCESGRPIMTDPHTGQTVCSCQVDSRLLSYPRLATGLPVGALYGSAYSDQGYVSFGADPSAFYSPLNNSYDLKDSSPGAWSSLTQAAAYYSYDPTMGAYPYSNGYGGVDLNGAARRKNATKEVTSTLKAWLYEHRKNPYPTKGEKIMLAIITKMTLTQVSTWFANARRRLKKENKMTWEPRNRVDDDDKSDLENDESKDGPDSAIKDCKDETRGIKHRDMCDKALDSDDMLDGSGHHVKSVGAGCLKDRLSLDADSRSSSPASSLSLSSHTGGISRSSLGGLSDPSPSPDLSALKSDPHSHHHHHLMHHHHHLGVGGGNPNSKPRIWSLAHTATSNSPPLCRRSPPAPSLNSTGVGLHHHPGGLNASIGGTNPHLAPMSTHLGGASNGVSPYSTSAAAAALSAANKMSMAAAAAHHHHQSAVSSRPDLRTWIEGAFHGASALTAMGIAAQYHGLVNSANSLHAMQQQQTGGGGGMVMGHNGSVPGGSVQGGGVGSLPASTHLTNLNMSVRSVTNGNATAAAMQQHQQLDSSSMVANSMQGNGGGAAAANALQCRLAAPSSGGATGLKVGGYPSGSCGGGGGVTGATNTVSMGTAAGQTSLIASIKTNLCSGSPGDRVGLHAGLSNVNRTSSQVEVLSTAFRPVTKT